jgi:hypothetical protein
MKILTDEEGNKWEVLDIRSSRQPNQFIYTMQHIPSPPKSLEEEVTAEAKKADCRSTAWLPCEAIALCRVLDRRLKELEGK